MIIILAIALFKKSFFVNAVLPRLNLKIIWIFFMLIPVSGFSQNRTYAIIKGDSRIGTLTAGCLKNDSVIVYSIRSDAKAGFIFNIHVSVTIDEIYKSGQMDQSILIHKVNGKKTVNNEASKTSRGYILKKGGNHYKIFPGAVNYSMGAMYFVEPLNQNVVYSEKYQEFLPVKPAGSNRYLIEFPDGNKSYYTYVNGGCAAIEVHTGWAVLFFKLLENSAGNEMYTIND